MMQSKLAEVIYDVELQSGEPLRLPDDAAAILGPGHWLISIRPAGETHRKSEIRNHAALLNSYAPEDEGLYDDYSAG